MKTGIERLNDCFRAFPEETKALLHHWIPCPPGMEDHVVHREMQDGSRMVSVLGLLNGTVFKDGAVRLAYVATAPLDAPREEELASVEGYDLVPETTFSEAGSNFAPAPDDWKAP